MPNVGYYFVLFFVRQSVGALQYPNQKEAENASAVWD